MPYFQVPDDRKFADPASGLRSWPANSQGYRLYIHEPGSAEMLGVKTGQKIKLQQVGFDSAGKTPIVWSSNLNVVEPIGIGGISGDKQTFLIHAKNPGTATLTAKDGAGNDVAGPVTIVVGKYEKHPGMLVDLIADVGSSDDSLKLLALQRMLYFNKNIKFHPNSDNIFEQGSASNHHDKFENMACGIVAKFRGDQVFGNMTEVLYDHPYHEPLNGVVTKRSDVKYKTTKIFSLQTQIVAMLSDGKPVRVGVLDNPISMGTWVDKQKVVHYPRNLVAYWVGGHSVLIVGCNESGTRFMYIDPWGAGSQMEYLGGIAGNQPSGKCQQLGAFELQRDRNRLVAGDTDTRWNLMRQTSDTEGTFQTSDDSYLEVVAGPWMLK